MAKSFVDQLGIELFDSDTLAVDTLLFEDEAKGVKQAVVNVQDVKITPGRRAVDKNKVKELVKSIRELGLLNPITLTADNRLVAGAHRLQAYKDIGLTEIPVNYLYNDNDALIELAEIDENIVRNNLHFLENGKALARRKEIYEMLHPETKAGGDRRSEEIKMRAAQFENESGNEGAADDAPASSAADAPASFVADTASKTGQSGRKIWEDIQLNEKLTDTAKELIKQHSASKKEALQLSRMKPEQQEEVAAIMPEAGSLTRAIRLVNRSEKKPLPSLQEVRRLDAAPAEQGDIPKPPRTLDELIETLSNMREQFGGNLAVKLAGDGRGVEIKAVTRERTKKNEWICIE